MIAYYYEEDQKLNTKQDRKRYQSKAGKFVGTRVYINYPHMTLLDNKGKEIGEYTSNPSCISIRLNSEWLYISKRSRSQEYQRAKDKAIEAQKRQEEYEAIEKRIASKIKYASI